jgi:hypothetical protein
MTEEPLTPPSPETSRAYRLIIMMSEEKVNLFDRAHNRRTAYPAPFSQAME